VFHFAFYRVNVCDGSIMPSLTMDPVFSFLVLPSLDMHKSNISDCAMLA
jgi:hypothetical protein